MEQIFKIEKRSKDRGRINGYTLSDPSPTAMILPRKCGKSRIFAAMCLNLGERRLPLSSHALPLFLLPINTGFSEEKCTQKGYKVYVKKKRIVGCNARLESCK